MREAGRIVFRRLGADAEGSQSEPLARVYDISSRLPKTTAQRLPLKKISLLGSKIPKGKSLQKWWKISQQTLKLCQNMTVT